MNQPPVAGARAFATVITRSYLADARALAASIRRFHDDPIYVLCIDDPRGYFDPSAEPFTVLTLDDVLPPGDRAMTFYYTAFELCNAVRAYLHRYLLERTTHERWAYLDSDCHVVAPLDAMFAELDGSTTGLLTPHCITAAPARLLEPVETSLLEGGTYNSGFLALRRAAATAAFIDWFVVRLQRLCFLKERGCYVDQRWLNLVPEQFPTIRSWKHPGANVAYWNVHERAVRHDRGVLTAAGEPLLFMHFSRWRFDTPADVAWGRPLHPDTDPAALASLGLRYRDDLEAGGFRECRSWPYGFATFQNGRAITRAMRRDYYEQWLRGDASSSPPFDDPSRFPPLRYPPDMSAAVRRWARPLKPVLRALGIRR